MTNKMRLTHGGLIDRKHTLSFSFNGKLYKGFPGDTLASALLANGVRLTARSFKYHRPRGIIGVGSEEPATLVELQGDSACGNTPPTTIQLFEGLKARSVNCWPSPTLDFGSINQLYASLIPAGFYYKTFKWPDWKLYEPFIRRAAGLAAAPKSPPSSGHFETRNGHSDLLIAGAGPAGLMAALVAGRSGARVFLADDGIEAGGSILYHKQTIDGKPALTWVHSVTKELAEMDNVTHLQNATVWAYREHNFIMVNEKKPNERNIIERNWRIRASNVICATGAIERASVFPGNDRPGVMLASAVQGYVNRYAVAPGRRIALFTNNDSAYSVANDLQRAGIKVACVIDSRAKPPSLQPECVEVITNHRIVRVIGKRSVRAVIISPHSGNKQTRINCDVIAHSGGWNPAVHLFSQSRGTLKFHENLQTFVPNKATQQTISVGACKGTFTLQEALKEGAAASAKILKEPSPKIPEAQAETYSIDQIWYSKPEKKSDKAFLDFQNDVSVEDVHLALREGYSNIEHVKRYTTGGMGLDQGKVGNFNIIGTVATAQKKELGDVGTTTFRSPYAPISFGAMHGTREDSVALPYRHTPITHWNLSRGAFMYEAGARWRRPGYFPRKNETFQETVNRECLAVRKKVGAYDGSPLGKFELKGADVGKFLDQIYTNVMSTLKPGHGRYGMMLNDDGMILDDGVAFRIDDHRWLLSTSTGHADLVNMHMHDLLQTTFSGWQVMITPVTSQWNNVTICGPLARDLMLKLGTDINLDPDAFSFMSFREGNVGNIPARVVRVSFTGELSFEVNVAPRHVLELWLKVLEVGAKFDIQPVGSEASHVLRVEKGFLSLGHEVDGTVDPYDLGLGWLMSKKKKDYLGRRSVTLRRASGKIRRELVGIVPEDPSRSIPEGAPLTPGGRKTRTEGLCTACVWSVTNEKWVGLALLDNGRARVGEKAHVRLKDRVISVQITEPIHYDPEGVRLRS